MPLSIEEMASHNFSSNNRIKRSLSAQNGDYSLRDIVQQLLNVKKGNWLHFEA